MKRIVLLFAAAALVLSAGAQTAKKKAVGKKAVVAAAPVRVKYTVSGTAESLADGTKVYLGVPTRSGFDAIDSATVKEGKYTLKFNAQKTVKDCSVARKEGKKYRNVADVILENTNITVSSDKEGKSTVVGGPENKLMQEYKAIGEQYNAKMMPLYQMAVDTTKTREERVKARDDFEKLQNEQFGEVAKFVKANVPSGVSSILLGYYGSAFDGETIDGILAEMKAKCPTDPVYLQYKKQREMDAKVAIGKHYVDIALKTPEGKLIKVSDFVGKNKITMIDFWASWCGPCRGEMPNVIKAYNEYKDKGFGVVGVSLDNDAAAWKSAIKSLGIPWPQMSDLKGWQSAGAALYNVRSIPATVLIDQNGKIIAKDLRGDDLEAKLKELLK